MFFKPLIDRWGVAEMAADLGLPSKNVRSWRHSDSIPAEWFGAIERAAAKRGLSDVTGAMLIGIAERRRVDRAPQESGAAA